MAVRQELLYYIKGNPPFTVQYTDIPKYSRDTKRLSLEGASKTPSAGSERPSGREMSGWISSRSSTDGGNVPVVTHRSRSRPSNGSSVQVLTRGFCCRLLLPLRHHPHCSRTPRTALFHLRHRPDLCRDSDQEARTLSKYREDRLSVAQPLS